MKVTLLGDSIRLFGYGKKVAALLEQKAEVWQPGDNCRFCQYILRGLFDWRENIEGSDIVHFNTGLWDMCRIVPDGEPFTPLDDYIHCVKRIVNTLRAYGVKKIIFSTTTPCRAENPYNRNEDIEKYNAAIVPVLKEMDVEIIDLYSALKDDIEGNISDDLIHLTDKAADISAKVIAERILCAVSELENKQ